MAATSSTTATMSKPACPPENVVALFDAACEFGGLLNSAPPRSVLFSEGLLRALHSPSRLPSRE